MKSVLAALIAAGAIAIATEASAFDRCDRLFQRPQELEKFIYERAVGDAPVRYFDRAREITIRTVADSEEVFPFAYTENGEPFVDYPSTFPPMLCRFVLATYVDLANHHKSTAMGGAAQDAATCVDAKVRFGTCLNRFAANLERQYGTEFAGLDSSSKEIGYTFVRHALSQIAKHEFAHILLDHESRVSTGEIPKIDAEFEADFYAIRSAVLTGEISTAMYYFFAPLNAAEKRSGGWPSSRDYEPGPCRMENVGLISTAVGIGPAILVATASGERQPTKETLLASIVDAMRREKQSDAQFVPSCGRLKEAVLRKTRVEILSLLELVAQYEPILGSSPAKQGDPAGGMGLRTPRALELVERIRALSQNLQYLKSLAARVLSLLIQRIGYAGKEATVSKTLDEAIGSSRQDFLASDYGRLLKQKGLIILYETPALSVEKRMDQAQTLFEQTVSFLPASFEAWVQLGYIALARGDCAKAAGLAAKAAPIAGSRDNEVMAEELGTIALKLTVTGCKEMANKFKNSIFTPRN
jgi:hypothetical protein